MALVAMDDDDDEDDGAVDSIKVTHFFVNKESFFKIF